MDKSLLCPIKINTLLIRTQYKALKTIAIFNKKKNQLKSNYAEILKILTD